MQEQNNKKTIIFQGQEFPVTLQQEVCSHFPQETLVSFLFQHKYTIKAEVNEEIFKSFLEYLNNKKPPNIDMDNFEEYSKLNEEFQIPTITQIIQSKKELYTLGLTNIHKLQDENLSDKSDIERQVSQNLDNYIIHYGEELIKIPVQSLFNILSSKDCQFTLNDRLYELIMSHHQTTNNSEIFVLLQFLNGNSILPQYLTELIENKDQHYGFIPTFNSPKLLIQKLSHKLNDDDQSIQFNKIYESGLSYKLDDSNSTATVMISRIFKNVHIPRSIRLDSKDYLITSFESMNNSLDIITKHLSFSEDSAIEKVDLTNFQLESVSIPPSVNELIIGWNEPKSITISQNNPNYEFDGSFLYGKSKQDIDEFDTLIYAVQSINQVSIPSNIKCISSYCFCKRYELMKVNFLPNSNLIHISDHAFACCYSIESIKIPPSVISIGMNAFYNCKNLKSVEFTPDSKLKYIGHNAFSECLIELITIPQHVIEIVSSFNSCKKLHTVKFVQNSELKIIGYNAFSDTLIKSITIPNTVTAICANAFMNCHKLQTVSISPDSNLQVLGDFCFSGSSIKSIFIPKNVTHIGDYAFYGYKKLTTVTFDPDSILYKAGENAFIGSLMERIEFPSSICILKGGFDAKITEVVIPPNNSSLQWIDGILYGKSDPKIDSFDTLILANKEIEQAIIPKDIKFIENYCFSECIKLTNVTFLPGSQLQFIGSFAFYQSSIESIIIPQHVKSIEESTFKQCKKLQNVTFSPDSELQLIKESAFAESPISSIAIPYHVKKIKEFAFRKCSLNNVEFADNCELRYIEREAFSCNYLLKTVNIPKRVSVAKSAFINDVHHGKSTKVNFI